MIRDRVLRGIALNREPGLHFAGNFLDLSFDTASREAARASFVPGPHCEESDGQASIGAVAMLADMGLATSIRAQLSPETRLATVSMHLQFNGAPLAGPMEALGTFEGFLEGASGQQGLARVSLLAGGREAALGTGAFMVLKPPPGVMLHPVRPRGAAPPLQEADLKRDERAILRLADAALAKADAKHSFIRNFWGYTPRPISGGASCTLKNGAHVGNRVGHVQGGLLAGLAAVTAAAALPSTWMLSAISTWFVSPGEGATLRAKSKVIHHGRLTAVVRTEILGPGRRRVLEAVTTHALRKS
jgi:acyl-coenzyme A thioesterase PaaI-like protein